MPAPFVISHLQINSLLEGKGARFTDNQRAGVFLTNALTGWVPEEHPHSEIFEEFRREREDSEHIKQQDPILVILGNPPYNGYAGIARIEEERDLTNAYREPIPGLPAPQGQGLNDLYIRFFRVAERRIAGNVGGQGIVSFISNNAWLDGLSHPTMRYRYLHAFRHIFVDNLNGDKYRTGKTTPDGLPDPSAFSTPQNREGIQLGTAVTTLVRNRSGAVPTGKLHLRDIWGTGKLTQLERESRHEDEPEYISLIPVDALGDLFAHRTHSAAYTTWPRLRELFPVSFPGVKTSRDSLVVDIDRSRLEARMVQYFGKEKTDAEIAEQVPSAMERSARFDPIETRRTLQDKGFRPWQIIRYAYRPFDLRWLYWEPETKLLDEKREDFIAQVTNTRLWLEIRQREASDKFCRGTLNRCLSDQLGNGMSHFVPNTIFHGTSLYNAIDSEQLNLSEEIALLATERGMDRPSLFFHTLATLHTPRYRTENAGALLGDWPRIPVPATAKLLASSATLGRRLADLLDAESAINLASEWSLLAALKLPHNADLERALKLTSGWGYRGQGSTVMPGQGLSPDRPWSTSEREKIAALAATQSLSLENALALLGEICVDVHLNVESFWSAIPINVWNYTLGGYQVLKKWLSYREFPLLGRPLHSEEAAYFAQVVRRIAAIILLGPALDASYQVILPAATGLPTR